jgi:hypothetical protein
MRPYIVRHGDYLTELAFRLGFDGPAVWEAEENAGLRALRDNPNQLNPGDVLHIPAERAQSTPRAYAHVTNRYVATLPRVRVRVVLRTPEALLANEEYQVDGLPEAITGTTGADGSVTLVLPLSVRVVSLYLPRVNAVFPVELGELDPVTEPSGVRQRLEHLGYYGWAIGSGAMLPRATPDYDALDELAVRAFQRASRLVVSGLVDDQTRDALRAAHGS